MFTDKKHPEITDIVKNIRYTNGEESIELDNGGLIEFSARSRQAARGFDGISLVVFDEAQELMDDQVEAIKLPFQHRRPEHDSLYTPALRHIRPVLEKCSAAGGKRVSRVRQNTTHGTSGALRLTRYPK